MTQKLDSNDYQLTNGNTRNHSSGTHLNNSVILRVDLDFNVIAGVNTSYSGYKIQGVCNGTENVDPLMFDKTSLCEVQVDPKGNQLIFHNCTDGILDMQDFDVIIRKCTNCVEVYIVGRYDS